MDFFFGAPGAMEMACVSDGVKTDEPTGLKSTELRNSMDHRSGLSLSVAPNEF